MNGIPLSKRQIELFDWLSKRGVVILDQRDPIGKERTHGRESEEEIGIGRLGMPESVSGRCTRNPEGAARILGSALEAAAQCLQDWDNTPPNQDTPYGGQAFSRPIAVVLANYGAHVLSDDRDKHIRPFACYDGV